jgi:hypothetical protein
MKPPKTVTLPFWVYCALAALATDATIHHILTLVTR